MFQVQGCGQRTANNLKLLEIFLSNSKTTTGNFEL